MNFVYPQVLWALSLISIPIIIHLFNFRKYKKIFFSDIRFLKEVTLQTHAKRQLRHLLILITRIFVIIFIVTAFAQPFIPAEENAKGVTDLKEKAINIYIDNSFSASLQSIKGSLLDVAKQNAIEIVSSYKGTDQFQLLTNDFEAPHQRFVSKEEFLLFLDEVNISPSVRTISEVISRQKGLLLDNPAQTKISYIISDFQKSISDFNQINVDTNIITYFIPLIAEEQSNLYVDSCWFAKPIRQLNQVDELFVKIINNSDRNYEDIPIKLFINNEQKSLASFNISPHSSAEVKLTFTNTNTGIQNGCLEITDYPVIFDDKLYFSYFVAEQIPILCINPEQNGGQFINALFKSDSSFILRNVFEDKIDYSVLRMNNLIILNELSEIPSGLAQELERFVSQSGSLVIFPAKQIDSSSYRDFLSIFGVGGYSEIVKIETKVDKINFEHPLYRDVFELDLLKEENIDLPVIRSYYKVRRAGRSMEEWLMKLQNGDLFMAKYDYEKGKIYLCSIPLDEEFSNFPKHPIFVPTLLKIALYSQTQNQLYYTIGYDNIININLPFVKEELNGDLNIFHIKDERDEFDIIPFYRVIGANVQIDVSNQITKAGNFTLTLGDNKIMGLSFNYDRKESDLSSYDISELKRLVSDKFKNQSFISIFDTERKQLSSVLKEQIHGKRLWKLFIICALIFLALEILLLRLWRIK